MECVAEKTEVQTEELLVNIIKQQVLAKLGTPPDLWRIDVMVDGVYARVNVRRQMDQEAATDYYAQQKMDSDDRAKTAKKLQAMNETIFKRVVLITDSFYVTLKDGIIVRSSPTITKRYE